MRAINRLDVPIQPGNEFPIFTFMRPLFIFCFCFCLIQLHAQSDELALERALYDLPGVQFEKISKPGDKYLTYALQIKQPLDHQHPDNGSFYQSAVLIHKGFERPMVMETEGYELYAGEDEIADILNANDIDIEFRYFGQSRPETLQWQYLTFAQACADLHHINELLKTIYSAG